MALPAPVPHPSGRSADPQTPERLAPALRVALDRRHPSCGDLLVAGTCQALANCPLAPACAPPDAPVPTRHDDDPTVVPLPPRPDTPSPDEPDESTATSTPTPIPAPVRGRALAPVPTSTPAPTLAPVPTRALAAVPTPPARGPRHLRAVVRFGRRDDRGQATAEYGLVILVAGLIALGVIAWARGTGSFTDLFESVIDSLTSGL
jgi:Flp pilus assembly pilin Flp